MSLNPEYVVIDIRNNECFVGSKEDGPYFMETKHARTFPSEGAAKSRIATEHERYPEKLASRMLAIIPVYTF